MQTGYTAVRGNSFFSLLIMLVLIGSVAVFGMRVGYGYYLNSKVQHAFDALPEKVSMTRDVRGYNINGFKQDVMTTLYKYFRVNSIRDVPLDDVKFERVENGVKISMQYEYRRTLLRNIDLVMRFRPSVVVPMT
jgi:hypothetical protein